MLDLRLVDTQGPGQGFRVGPSQGEPQVARQQVAPLSLLATALPPSTAALCWPAGLLRVWLRR